MCNIMRDPMQEASRLSLLDWHHYDSLHGVCFASLAGACELKAWLLQYNLTKFHVCENIYWLLMIRSIVVLPRFLRTSGKWAARIDW